MAIIACKALRPNPLGKAYKVRGGHEDLGEESEADRPAAKGGGRPAPLGFHGQ